MAAKYVHDGDDLIIDANVYNACVDLYQKSIGNSKATARFKPTRLSDTRIMIQNLTGADLPRFGIVALTIPLIDPPTLSGGVDSNDETDGDYDTDIFETICMDGQVATFAENQYSFGIVQEAIPSNEYGECLVSGISFALLNPPPVGGTGYLFAVPNGTTSGLDAAQCGICRVIWRNDGNDLQWAIVHIG